MNRELLQQALDALLHSDSPSQKRADAITALKQALAAPQPEPVAWRVPVANAEAGKIGHIYAEQRELVSYFGRPIEPLYAAPPAAPAPAVPDGAVLYCGHPASLAVKSAETGKTLYCDLCDAKSGRRDAEQMEAELREENLRLREAAKSVAPAVPDLKHKPTVQRLMDLARKFRSAPGDLYDGAYKELQSACYEALSAAPVVREPQDERIRWRDAVIKEAESALRTAEQEFADMPTWSNVGHAAKKVAHALAVIAALGIGGGGK